MTSGASTNLQTKCINTAITTIIYSTTGATGATFSGLPTGVTGNWLANVVTISGTPSVSGTFNYTITLTGGCGIVNATGTITVILNNTIALTSARLSLRLRSTTKAVPGSPNIVFTQTYLYSRLFYHYLLPTFVG